MAIAMILTLSWSMGIAHWGVALKTNSKDQTKTQICRMSMKNVNRYLGVVYFSEYRNQSHKQFDPSLRQNMGLWLDVASHVTSFNQLGCFISAYLQYAKICLVHWKQSTKIRIALGTAKAQWIRLCLPSCRPGFDSQAHHLCFNHL